MALIVVPVFTYIITVMVIEYNEKPLTENDIVKFKGELISVKKDNIRSKRNSPILFLKLKDVEPVFKISGASYAVLADKQINAYLKTGNEIEIGTTKKELIASKKNSSYNAFLNSVISTRDNPQVFFFRCKNSSFFDLERYNKIEEERKKSNLILGIPLFIIAIGFTGLCSYQYLKSRS